MLGPNIHERLARALADLRTGVPVIISGNQDIVFASVETLSDDRWNIFNTLQHRPHLVISDRRAQTLKIPVYDGTISRLSIPNDRGLDWIKSVADPSSDLAYGLKGPFETLRDGHIDGHYAAILICKLAHLLPAAIVAPLQNDITAGITKLELNQITPILEQKNTIKNVIAARLPTNSAPVGKLHVFRPDNGGQEHYAMEIGKVNPRESVLVRIHSACFTGDVLGSLKCDCGAQLAAAMQQMGQEGQGLLLYLNQEGRGIGLTNKMRAYSLQDQGFDTVEANHRLGFEDDERDFRLASSILKQMGIKQIRLLTNNPKKIEMMQSNGIIVDKRVPLKVGKTNENAHYLATKASKSGHLY